MDAEWIAEHEVRFGGQEGALTVLLGVGPTGVLVSQEMRIECGPLDGLISGFFDFDAAEVEQALRRLLATRDLTGEVRLTGSEHGEFRATVNLERGSGVLSATFASEFGLQDGGGTLTLTTDQSYLAQSQRALSLLVKST